MNHRSEKAIFDLFALTAPGLEQVCALEAEELGLIGVRAVPGGVEFTGPLRDLYRANLWLRTASRILARAGECRCRDFPTLYRHARRIPWGRFVRPGTPLEVRAASRRSRLTHSGRIGATVQEAISCSLGEPPVNPQRPAQLVLVRIEDDQAVFSVDSSGELLHRRGYRTARTQAPMRETLAAGVLRLLEWDRQVPLIDPMCGSGTLPIEAALWARNVPPGRQRIFAFMNWPRYREGLWQALLIEADRSIGRNGISVQGMDGDPAAVAAAGRNAGRAGVEPFIRLRVQDLADLKGAADPGLVVCNPPYGKRIGGDADLFTLFREFGEVCRRQFPGWRIGFLSPEEDLAKATGLPVILVSMLRNGGIPVGLFRADLA